MELASLVPGAERQALHHFLHDAPWDGDALNRRRLQLWQAHPFLGPRVRSWLCPWARLQAYWQHWSITAPPPEMAALLAHLARSRPLDLSPAPA